MVEHSDLDIERLILQSKAGTKDSFKELYNHLSDRLFAYIAGRVSSRDEALDVLQEVFVDLWRALPKFQYTSPERFYGFVFTIVKRRLIKVYRAKKPVDSLEEIADLQAEESIVEPGERVALERALEKLDETSRDIIELRYWGGLPFAEIAALLHMKETTVKVRHHRAMQELQGLFIEYGTRT